MDYKEFSKQLIEYVGGEQNIDAVVHCMTRLRFTLKNRDIVQSDKIQNLEGVIDTVSNKISYQVVIGTEVADIYPVLMSELGKEGNSLNQPKEKKNILKSILDLISETITAIIPAILAAGLVSAILSIFTVTGLLSPESPTFVIFDTIKQTMFASLSVFIAVSAAKRLGAPLYMAVLLALTTLSPNISGVDGLKLFGLTLPTTTYQNTFIPILLGIWFMGLVTKYVKKYMPKSLDYFFSPVLIIMITLPVTLLIFGPIGTWISDGLTMGVNFLSSTFGNWIVVALYGAFNPFLIMLGAGNFVVPLIMNAFATNGFDSIFVPGSIISDFAVCGTMLGYMLRAKNSKQKQMFGGFSFSAFMGITEPAVFGAFVKYRRPFLSVIIGGGLGGLFAGLMQVKGYTMTTLFGIFTFIGENDYKNFYFMLAALAIGFVAAATAGYLLWLPKEEVAAASTPISKTEVSENKSINQYHVCSPVEGQRVSLKDVKDDAFATGALGKGIGIVPESNIIAAPIDGEVLTLFPTNHAIGIRNSEGLEILIHVGIDTVDLAGKYFKSNVKQGDFVKQGQPLLEVDFENVRKEGYDPTVMMVVTNSSDYLEIVPNVENNLEEDNNLLTVII